MSLPPEAAGWTAEQWSAVAGELLAAMTADQSKTLVLTGLDQLTAQEKREQLDELPAVFRLQKQRADQIEAWLTDIQTRLGNQDLAGEGYASVNNSIQSLGSAIQQQLLQLPVSAFATLNASQQSSTITDTSAMIAAAKQFSQGFGALIQSYSDAGVTADASGNGLQQFVASVASLKTNLDAHITSAEAMLSGYQSA
ncbi:MAG: hypothetical protein AAF607_03925 [Pseudomonadota bacterium]